ncbi:MAG: hypothetical protein B5M53_03830 [Candidatus Cloacimonas sp. 4484_209]|nr:MAG: hypothetical protein B5M53_03830 [Candidatus Cloacimonas sp. 4484_209]
MKKKRIVFLDHTAKISGGERSLLLILKKLDRTRFNSCLVTLEDGPLLEEAKKLGVKAVSLIFPRVVLKRRRRDIGLVSLCLSLFVSLSGIFRLVKLLKTQSFDIVYTNSQKSHLIGLIAGIIAGVPVVWHFRDVLPDGIAKRVVILLGNMFAKRIIVISCIVAKQFIVAGRIRSKVRVVYNAIDLHDFIEQAKNSKTSLKKEFHLPDNSQIVATVGQIARWKGQEYIVYVAEALIKRFDNLYFFIIGEPLFAEDAYYRKIKDLVIAKGLEKRVLFTGFRWDIPGIMKDIDILLHTPVEPEPFGRVIIEAMAVGTPVVAFDMGALKEILRDSAGILISPFDTKGLEETITSLLLDKQSYRMISKNAEIAVRNRFDSFRLITELEELLTN